MEYQEEFECACEHARQSLPREAYGAAQWNLHHGPSGGGASMTWQESIDALSAWSNNIQGVTLYECGEGEDGEECEIEAGYIEASAIVREVLGAELASYV